MTWSYTASYGVGKGQHHVSGTVTADNEQEARTKILQEMRTAHPVSAQRRTIRVQTIEWIDEPESPATDNGTMATFNIVMETRGIVIHGTATVVVGTLNISAAWATLTEKLEALGIRVKPLEEGDASS